MAFATFIPVSHFPFTRTPATRKFHFRSTRRIRSIPNATLTFPTNTSPTKSLPIPDHSRQPGILGIIIDLFHQTTINARFKPGSLPVYRADFFGFPLTMVSDLETIHQIHRDQTTFPSKGSYPPTFLELLGSDNLFSADGSVHAAQRKIMQPAFAPAMMSMYFDIMTRAAGEFWQNISRNVEQNGTVKLADTIKSYYLQLIIKITSGISETDDEESKELISSLEKLFVKVTNGLFSPMWGPVWNKATESRDSLQMFYREMICTKLVENKEIIDHLRNSGDDTTATMKRDLKKGDVDILTVAIALSSLETGEGKVHDEEKLTKLCEMMIFIWFAGYLTQASTTLSCVLNIGMNDDIKERLEMEQRDLIARNGEKLTIEQIMKEMPLLDSYVMEILRLFPAAPTIMRKLSRDVLVCGHLLKKDEIVGLDILGSQRDGKYYSDPEELKMERFMPGSEEIAVKIMTFGAPGGSHYCLGAGLAKVSIKVFLATMIREFRVELDKGQEMKHVNIPEMKPVSGVKIVQCQKRDRHEVL